MPKVTVSKESLEGLPPLPTGRYTFRLDSFEPKLSKPKPGKTQSVNLNASLVIINHPDAKINGRKLTNNANVGFAPSLFDMAHAVGVRFENEGTDNPEFPGEFQCRVHGPNCDSSDPENWSYIGPLVGQTGELEIMMGDNGKGGQSAKLGKFYCRVPGCTAKHAESLV